MNTVVTSRLKAIMQREFRSFQVGLIALSLALVVIIYLFHQNTQLNALRQSDEFNQYEVFIAEQFALARFDRSFELRQQHYASFMGALSDTWLHMNQKDAAALQVNLNELAKAFYALEPFLESGDRHELSKRIARFHRLVVQLVGSEQEGSRQREAKTEVNDMIESFQTQLYPLLFEPRLAAVEIE